MLPELEHISGLEGMASYDQESEADIDIPSRLSRVTQMLNETGLPMKRATSDACKADVQSEKNVQFSIGSLIESQLVLADSVNDLAKQLTKQDNMFRSLERDSIIAVSALQKHVETSTHHCESQIAALVQQLQEQDIHGKHEPNRAMADSPAKQNEDYMLKEMAAVREENRQSHEKMNELVHKLVDEFQHSEKQLLSHIARKYEELEQASLAHRESLIGQVQASVAELYEQVHQSNSEHVSLSHSPGKNDNDVDDLVATIRHEVMAQVSSAEQKFFAAKSRLEAEQQKLQEIMSAFGTQLTQIVDTQVHLTQMAETQGRPPQNIYNFSRMSSVADSGLSRNSGTCSASSQTLMQGMRTPVQSARTLQRNTSTPTILREGCRPDDSAAQVVHLGSPRHTVTQSKPFARCVSPSSSDPSSGNVVRAASQVSAWGQPITTVQTNGMVNAVTQSAPPPAWQPSQISQVPPQSPSSSRRESVPNSPKRSNGGSIRVPVITQQRPVLQASDLARYVPRGLQKTG